VAGSPVTAAWPTLAVFASDKGRGGDPERSSIMSQVGAQLARRGARVVCLVEGALEAVPLVTSARTAGGDVLIIADEGFAAPAALRGVQIERLADAEARLLRVAELADGFVGLPGSLASAGLLYRSWQRAGAGASGKPVVLLNRNRAFETLRGMAADIVSHSVPHADRIVCFTDSVEDVWNKVAWALNVSGHQAPAE